jgi:tetratricopeptide (TPR) repeat protein
LFSRSIWIAVAIIVAVLLYDRITTRSTIIDPISVPRILAENGYTPEVTAQRLRDAIIKFQRGLNSHMESVGVAIPAEIPNIVVPTVGLSMDAIASALRGLVAGSYSRRVSGEFTLKDKTVSMLLRIDGREIYRSAKGVEIEKIDELFDPAVPQVLNEIRPYLVALATSRSDPMRGIELAKDIISRLPESDENVAWCYNLIGSELTYQKRYSDSEAALRKAIELNPRLAVAYTNLGNLLVGLGSYEDGIAAHQRAIALQPRMAVAHNNLGVAFRKIGKEEEAISAYHAAIKAKRDYARAYLNLGMALSKTHDRKEEGVTAFRRAIKIEPNNVSAYTRLADLLSEMEGRELEAVTAYRDAARIDPDNADLHVRLGDLLSEIEGRKVEAIAAYREAIRIDPNKADAYNNLGVELRAVGRLEEAEIALRKAIELDPHHEYASDNLRGVLRDMGK